MTSAAGANREPRVRPTSAAVTPVRPSASSVCSVVQGQGSNEIRFDRDSVERLLAAGEFFWLDLDQAGADDFEILRDVFEFHPLAVEDSEQFGQRAKIEDYDDFVFIVVYGAAPDDDRLVEVHCFYSERFLVTVHRDDCPAFAEIRAGIEQRGSTSSSRRCCSTVSSTAWSTASSRSSPTSTTASTSSRTRSSSGRRWQLQEIFKMKRLLIGMRKVVTPAARHVRTTVGRRRRAARAEPRRRALLP